MPFRVACLRDFRGLLLAVAALILCACATTPPAHGVLVEGRQATIDGEVVSVDTTPWTYDGNAVVIVTSADTGTVRVQLPARWNLCKAQAPDDVNALKPGDRVKVIGTATGKDGLVVCAETTHQLRKAG